MKLIWKKFRDFAGLPNCNTATELTELVLEDPTAVDRIQQAVPLDGNRGGLLEYWIYNVEQKLALGRLRWQAHYVIKGGF